MDEMGLMWGARKEILTSTLEVFQFQGQGAIMMKTELNLFAHT